MDSALLFWIQENMRCGFMDDLMLVFTQLGSIWFAYCLILVLLLSKRTRRAGIFLMFGIILNLIITSGLKEEVARLRPFVVYEVEQLVHSVSYSFPSGHSVVVTIIAGTLLIFRSWWGFVMMAVAPIVMFSRLYFFVHFPTDVICGCFVGAAIVIVLYLVFDYLENRSRRKEDGVQPI